MIQLNKSVNIKVCIHNEVFRKIKKIFFLVPACIHITRQRAEEQMLDQDVAIWRVIERKRKDREKETRNNKHHLQVDPGISVSYLFVHLLAIKYQGPIKISDNIKRTNQKLVMDISTTNQKHNYCTEISVDKSRLNLFYFNSYCIVYTSIKC